MIIKTHKNEERIIVAVCDSEILGKKFEEGDMQLDLSSEFFMGKEEDDVIIGDTLRNADSVNLVGKKAVKLGLEEGVIEEENIKSIGGIPYAQALLIQD